MVDKEFVKSPDTVALISAIQHCIGERAVNRMTPIEVIGALEFIKFELLADLQQATDIEGGE